MEPTSGIATFSHLLNIKDKLFPRKNETEISGDAQNINDKYCSLFLEHSYQPGNLGDQDIEVIELVLAKKSKFTIPIRHLDWKFAESKLDSVKPINLELGELLLISENGCLLNFDLKDILSTHIQYLQLKEKELKRALKSLVIQCTYADGYNQKVNAPESLKLSIFEYYKHTKTHNNTFKMDRA